MSPTLAFAGIAILILAVGGLILRSNYLMSQALDDLTQSVHDEETVIDSAVALINGFADRLDAAVAAGASADELTALAAEVRGKSDALSAAVVANTPAE